MQTLAAAVQQRIAQGTGTHDNGIYEVERATSSKVPWLVVGPDGVCSVAHKLRADPIGQTEQSKSSLVRTSNCAAALYPACLLPGLHSSHHAAALYPACLLSGLHLLCALDFGLLGLLTFYSISCKFLSKSCSMRAALLAAQVRQHALS